MVIILHGSIFIQVLIVVLVVTLNMNLVCSLTKLWKLAVVQMVARSWIDSVKTPSVHCHAFCCLSSICRFAVPSLSQRLSDVASQPTTTANFRPIHRRLAIKKSVRCKVFVIYLCHLLLTDWQLSKYQQLCTVFLCPICYIFSRCSLSY